MVATTNQTTRQGNRAHLGYVEPLAVGYVMPVVVQSFLVLYFLPGFRLVNTVDVQHHCKTTSSFCCCSCLGSLGLTPQQGQEKSHYFRPHHEVAEDRVSVGQVVLKGGGQSGQTDSLN